MKNCTSVSDKICETSKTGTRTMMAAVCEAPGKYSIKAFPVPTPGANEILVHLKGCGICSSNLPVWEGRPWFKYPLEKGAPGHEGWGRIEETGSDVKSYFPGQWVALLSQNAFAEYNVVSENMVVPIPSQLEGICLPGEPLGCAMNIFNRCNIRKGQNVAVVGAGFIGLILSSLALGVGANVVVISRNRSALKFAQRIGVETTVEYDGSAEESLKIKNRLCPDGYDCVIEATGYQKPLDLAGELVKIRGRLIIAGFHQDGFRSVNMQSWNWRGIDVINAHEREPQICIDGIRTAIKAVERKQLDPQPFFTHIYTLDEINEAFDTVLNRPEGFVKALVML